VIDFPGAGDPDATRHRGCCDDGGRFEREASNRKAAERYATAGCGPAADDGG
jgi:hypothetical protein